MQLTTQQSYTLLEKFGVYAIECCDQCRQVLGPVRFTRRGDTGIWCRRECRGDGDRRTIRKGGRPRKYKAERDRHKAERRQNAERQKAFRGRVRRNGKPSAKSCVPNGPETQKTRLSHYPLTLPLSARESGFCEGGSKSG